MNIKSRLRLRPRQRQRENPFVSVIPGLDPGIQGGGETLLHTNFLDARFRGHDAGNLAFAVTNDQ